MIEKSARVDAKYAERKKLVLFVSPFAVYPVQSGNAARTASLIDQIRARGHDVHFLLLSNSNSLPALHDTETPCHHIGSPSSKWAKRFGRLLSRLTGITPSTGIDSWYDHRWHKRVKSIMKELKPDVVIVTYVFFSKVLRVVPKSAIKMIDTQDVFHLRSKRLREGGLRNIWYHATKKEELKGLLRADAVLAITREDQCLLQSILDIPVLHLGHRITVGARSDSPSSNKVLFFASRSTTNLHGLAFLCRDVWPLVRQACPDATLVLAGTICENKDYDDCLRLGIVADLWKTYDQVDVVVNPVSIGTGLSIKSIEALSFGKPLVTTPWGKVSDAAEALQPHIIASTAADFAASIISILRDPELRMILQKNARLFVESSNIQADEALNKLLSIRKIELQNFKKKKLNTPKHATEKRLI